MEFFQLDHLSELSTFLSNTNSSKLKEIIKDYVFYYISQTFDINQKIYTNFAKSKSIILYQYKKENQIDTYFIIGFEKTIIIVDRSLISILKPLFSTNKKVIIYFFSNKENSLDKDISHIFQNQIIQCDKIFLDEIKNFCININIQIFPNNQIKKLWKKVRLCISGYLIKQSYAILSKKQKKLNFQNGTFFVDKKWKKKDYIELRTLGNGSLSTVSLYYHIITKELFAVKKTVKQLFDREVNNYKTINHTSVPKLRGIAEDDKYLIIQFINGQTLLNISKLHLSIIEKNTIVLQILSVFFYLHMNDFVYRDLKPDNIIIDENKNIFIIDFDRMLKVNEGKSIECNHTSDFSSVFVAPEVNEGIISKKNDIYSIGLIIYYIMNEKYPVLDEQNKIVITEDKFNLSYIYEACTRSMNQRPAISDLVLNFVYYCFHKENKHDKNYIIKVLYYYSLASYHHIIQTNLGFLFIEGIGLKKDVNKAVYYFTLAAYQNDHIAQYNLGLLYYNGIYVTRDINKSIYFFTLASKQNCVEAQYFLGVIYINGKCCARDVNKAIHYFELAANNNDPRAQYNLGVIYSDGNYIVRDINRAIYYYKLAANQNDTDSQYNLGVIFAEGKYVEQNINKAIYYYSLAANQNHCNSLIILGIFYYFGRYVKKDINKAIHYLELASDQNNPYAQYCLGTIFILNEDIPQDINKSVRYFTLSAYQNFHKALYSLGIMYLTNCGVKKNYNKGIDFIVQAAKYGNIKANFMAGFFYHEGKHINRDVKKMLHYYCEASSFNNVYAKNNLGIVYKNGIGKEISKNIGYSMVYFDEAIRLFNDKVSMYNLSHIYIYEDKTEEGLNKSIDLLIKSSNQHFFQSEMLLCIALIKKHGFDYEKIQNELISRTDKKCKLRYSIIQLIDSKELYDQIVFNEQYELYKTIDFMYSFLLSVIKSNTIFTAKPKKPVNKNLRNLTSNFYEGYGIQ